MDKKTYEFISQTRKDPIVEWKTCAWTGEEFAIYQSDIDMLEKVSPTIGGQKFLFPLPTLSPESRFRRMMMFRNERKLYKRKCSKTGKSIVALYPEQYEGRVYAPDLWRSDNWDPLDFGRKFTPGRFYEDLKDLFTEVPFLNMFAFSNENSDYTNGSEGNRNCYMIFASDHNRDCYYSYSIFECKNVVDGYGCKWCENSYQIIECLNCMKTAYSQKVDESFNVQFSYHIKNCNNVFLCVGLKDKEYYYMNEFVGKERRDSEIVPMIEDIFTHGRVEEYQGKLQEMIKGAIVQNMNITNTQNGIWDLIDNSKNVLDCFEVHNAEDIRGVINANGCKDVVGWYVIVDGSQKVHEGIGLAANYSAATVWNSWTDNRDVYFSNFIMNAKNMFGAISCKNTEYIILNKLYTKDERDKNAIQIVQELQEKGKRGEFFDPEFSPFPYNDTVAEEYYPIKAVMVDGKESIINPDGKWTVTVLDPNAFISDAVLDLGWQQKIKIKWRTKENEINMPAGIQTIVSTDVPLDISQVGNDILDKAIVCEISGRPFKLSASELEFYRKNGFPLPHKHPDVRHQERLDKRPGRNISVRTCDNCAQEMLSVYAPSYPGKVYCETCYNKEVYS